jgi:hypothetical protein
MQPRLALEVELRRQSGPAQIMTGMAPQLSAASVTELRQPAPGRFLAFRRLDDERNGDCTQQLRRHKILRSTAAERLAQGCTAAAEPFPSQENAMSDHTTDRSRQDQLRINVNEPHEVRYWTQRLDCSEQELRAAVARGGVMAEDVRAALGRG